MNRSFSQEETEGRYCLGIDLGSASIGWAILLPATDDEPQRILNSGVRRFEAGVLGDIESGKDESRATARRDARGPRRQTWRRQYRLRKVFRVLQQLDLLPPSDDASHDVRNQILADLDRQLRAEYLDGEGHAEHQVLPYRLRATALDQKLSRHALGRALYHLAQRRGFLSNRKAGKKDEDAGVVKAGIRELAAEIQRTGNRTLGEYFASLDPEEYRIRGRWTARQMFVDEFEQIWKAQSMHHHDLDDEAHAQLHEAVFFQRKLKSQKGLIGACEHEPSKRHAPIACLEYQEFRLLQRVNDLILIDPANHQHPLIDQEPKKREALVAALMENESLTFTKIAKVLGLTGKKDGRKTIKWTFNLEKGGEKGIKGNTTAAKLIAVLGNKWHNLGSEDQSRLVDEILAFESEDVLARRLVRAWDLTEEEAHQVADLHLEQGYGSLSRKAMRVLLPFMRQGTPYATAREEAGYGVEDKRTKPVDTLPANHDCRLLRDLRNPAVARALSELRLVVNALIRTHGKPGDIRIELARELKHPRKRRKEMTDRIRKNEKLRSDAKAQILKDMGHERYCSHHNILKVRLAEECGWKCPYTGRNIGMEELVGDTPQFEIEHIIPFSRSFDNSFVNKTLCYHEENRRKGNKTPCETYSATDQWDEILARVGRFQGDRGLITRKLDLFKREKLDEADDFTNRQLNDTAYMSKLAADYLGLLYGGRIDGEGTMRVQVRPGRVTAYLRQRWNLNSVLGTSGEKERTDHRHHAVDAVVVALTGQGEVQQLSQAAAEARTLNHRGLFVPVDQPWDGFLSDVFTTIEQINVSSRVSRKLNGQLHDATILSPPFEAVDKNGKPITVHHVRKKLETLSKGMVDDIVDPHVRKLVQEKLDKLGGDPAKAFQDIANHPYFKTKHGRIIPIHKVRIRKSDKPIQVGTGSKRRYVTPGANHHLAVVAILDADGNEKAWEYRIVSRFEAVRRRQCSEEIIPRPNGGGEKFKFSLAGGEHVLMKFDGETERLYRVTVISQAEVEFVLHSDARPIKVRKKAKARVRCGPKKLKERGARKVTVDPLGNILPAND